MRQLEMVVSKFKGYFLLVSHLVSQIRAFQTEGLKLLPRIKGGGGHMPWMPPSSDAYV